MTYQQALEAQNEYSVNSSLIEKILLDRGVTAAGSYAGSADDVENIDLCYADLLVKLANNPDIREGSQSITFDKVVALRTAQSIYQKYGDGYGATIDGANIW